jgi:hypothetical protein
VWREPGAAQDFSVCGISDGRMLGAWLGTGGVRVAVAPSPLGNFGTSALAVALTTNDSGRVSLSRIGGTNYLLVASPAHSDGSGTKLYEDDSVGQDGSSWAYRSTLPGWQPTTTYTTYFRGPKAASSITVTGTGRWVCAYTEHESQLSSTDATAFSSIATSDDQGATWTLRLTAGFYLLGGIYGLRSGRNITVWQGDLWWGAQGDPRGWRWYRSTDDGVSWSIVAFDDTAVIFWPSFILADNNYLYMMETNGGGDNFVYRIRRVGVADDPTDPADYTTVVTQDMGIDYDAWAGGTQQGVIMGGRFYLTTNRYIFGQPSGWVVGAVGRR